MDALHKILRETAAANLERVTPAGQKNPAVVLDGAAPLDGQAAHLTQHDLARRWRMSERTLEAWRWRKRGPPYLRIGGKIIYRRSDVLAYEAAHLRAGGM